MHAHERMQTETQTFLRPKVFRSHLRRCEFLDVAECNDYANALERWSDECLWEFRRITRTDLFYLLFVQEEVAAATTANRVHSIFKTANPERVTFVFSLRYIQLDLHSTCDSFSRALHFTFGSNQCFVLGFVRHCACVSNLPQNK